MSALKRRDFLKITGALAIGSGAKATPVTHYTEFGVLVDTTECIGCRKCEYACKNAHNLTTESLEAYEDKTILKNKRRPDDQNLTVVNGHGALEDIDKATTVKVQCMHCDQPACLSACIVGAFYKDENGAVLWDEDKCIGCRYCMVACPFQIPAYEYAEALEPRVVKCDWCADRLKENKLPACVEICPVEALVFGKRSDIRELAHKKIKENPDKYIDHIYGEYEVGGTAWMYLAGKEFSTFGFPELNSSPAPGVSEAIQHGIFAYFVPPVALYAVLGGVMHITRKRDSEEEV